MSDKALVILSGGQDSTTVLFMAAQKHTEVHCITFDYEQRHDVEISSARVVAKLANVASHEVLKCGPLLLGTSPLTNKSIAVEQYENADVLPGGIEKTYVPSRNALFLTLASNRAFVLGCTHVYIGVSQEDFGGYPDCRADFISKMQDALNSGLDPKFQMTIVAPLMNITKADSVHIAQKLPGCMTALGYSHTCYNGGSGRKTLPNDPNYIMAVIPCGKCHACLLRERGFAVADVEDPIFTRINKYGAGQP